MLRDIVFLLNLFWTFLWGT